MSETTTKHDRKTGASLPNRIGIVVGGVAIASLAMLTLRGTDNTDHARNTKIEQEALRKADSAWNEAVVLHAGVNIHDSPFSTADQSNVVDTVDRGEVMWIDHPIEYVKKGNVTTSEDDITWLGFVTKDPHKKDFKDTADPKNIRWINYSALMKQSTPSASLIEVYNYPDQFNGVQGLVIDSDNNFQVRTGSEPSMPAGISFTMAERTLPDVLSKGGFRADPNR